MLIYTGHPLIDVGAAAMAAFVEKDDPATLTDDDYQKVADFIERNYTVQPLKSFLNVAFLNSGFTQPAYENQPEKRQLYAQKVSRSFGQDVPKGDEACVFTGVEASAVSFSVDESLPAGRAFREHVPMITGRGVINFLPGGDAGLPVSGLAMLAIQFFPMGCAKCAGKLLAVHSDNPRLTRLFAQRFLHENIRAMTLAQQKGEAKMPEREHSARTLLIKTLLDAEQSRQYAQSEEEPASITAYHLTNSGQSNPLDDKNPPLQIYYLPLDLTTFLATVVTGEYRESWNKLVQRAWQRPPEKKKEEDAETPFVPRYNSLYEDVMRLADDMAGRAPRFIRTYFLRLPRRATAQDDPTRLYRLRDEYDLVSWTLVKLFLERVIHMNDLRIEEIRTLGDRLAEYVAEMDDKRFFRLFSIEQRAEPFRSILIKANTAAIRAGYPPLFGLDSFVNVFHEGEELLRPNWRLARDLVLIRMVEQLYTRGWIGKNPDLVDEVSQKREEQAETES
jgi:CRISPR-associated protein Cst1